jgi:exodeoxyribonuclease VII large subunit
MMEASMTQPSFDLDYDDAAEPTFGVRELADAVNQVLRRGFREGVWVRGEIDGIQSRGGHVYFTLTENTDEGRASLSVALFASTWYRLRPVLTRHRLRLGNGLAVRIHGSLNLYAPTGRLSLVMDGIDVRFTLGQLAADRDALLARLTDAGLLRRNGGLTVPVVPLRVGLVASRGSAAWHDVLHELDASRIGFQVAHVDVRVQGADAAASVAAAVRTLGRRDVDVIVLVRGGGSRTDLATFDDEGIARAIAQSPVPVFTGLGHETDRSVADEVAHTSYKTPTALAAALVDRVRAYLGDVDRVGAAIEQRVTGRLATASVTVGALGHRIAARTAAAVSLADQRVDHVAGRVARESSGRLGAATDTMARAAERVTHRAPAVLAASERALDGITARVRANDPALVLARGWSITRRADGTVVRSAAAVAAGDELRTTLADGTVASRVEEVAS